MSHVCGSYSQIQGALNPLFPTLKYTQSINPCIWGTIWMSMVSGFRQTPGYRHYCPVLGIQHGQIHNIEFKNVHYSPGCTKLLVSPKKWAGDRGEAKFVSEGIYLKVMGKRYILVWNNGKSQSNILYAPECTFPEMPINQVQEGLTKFEACSRIFEVFGLYSHLPSSRYTVVEGVV